MTQPTPAEAAAQLAQDHALLPTDRDLRVYAATTLVTGVGLGVICAVGEALYGHWVWWLLASGAVLVLVAAISSWDTRSRRVVTRSARRLRGNGMAVSCASGLLLASWTDLPPALVLVATPVPCLLAAWLILTRGRR